MVKTLTDDNFSAALRDSTIPVLVDFFADWCGPCKLMAPVFEDLAQQYEGRILFCKIDIDKAPNTAAAHAVQSIPCLLFFKEGKEADRFAGFVDAHTLKMKIDDALAK